MIIKTDDGEKGDLPNRLVFSPRLKGHQGQTHEELKNETQLSMKMRRLLDPRTGICDRRLQEN